MKFKKKTKTKQVTNQTPNFPCFFYKKKQKYMDEVFPNVWLGQYEAVQKSQNSMLQQRRITHVVSIGSYEEWWKTRKEPKHMLLDFKDSPFVFVTDYFKQVFEFMDEATVRGNGVLIHCDEKRSRSGAIVVAYLMKKTQKQYTETLNKILAHSKKVMPNIGFQIQVLKMFFVFFNSNQSKKKKAKHSNFKQLRNFGKARWNMSVQYSNKINIEKELANALKNLMTQVSKLQSDITKKEQLYVTITNISSSSDLKENKDLNPKKTPVPSLNSPNGNGSSDTNQEKAWKRSVVIGLNQNDLNIFRKEWVLLAFLCHQFQLYQIPVHTNTINILYILGEMYFLDLLQTFRDIFQPENQSLVLDYDSPSDAIAKALQAYNQKDKQKEKEQTKHVS
ncbi:leucine rich repeat and phosphatase domain containing protein [Reticulomyxa filosa]|uniref:Leucine rich repeat and phosphatase domain containing protein n=1 Tax=Reticulomyxa filosa TaxID=46433 RepID=X6NNH0_RETFI|nr:leucine rich repeat and phosphatase domain containing protein [Reticulomyxa filosa]|eukprot:ETO26907.1 leucine rich repeat and phosphatase domain containing protein [Reticulomyxa filosa]